MFSIIMPVIGDTSHVIRAIESVLGQTFEDYELLIFDNSPKGGLAETVKPYLSQKVSYYWMPQNGLGAILNSGISRACHHFFAYLDPDHIWHAEFLAMMHKALTSDDHRHEAAYCMANNLREDAATGKTRSDGTTGEPLSFRKLLTGNYIDLNAFVHSRKTTQFAGMFDANLSSLTDWDLIIRVTALFEPVFVPEVLVDRYSVSGKTAEDAVNTSSSYKAVRRKNAGFREPVTFVHDAIEYKYEDLSEQKYRNWARIHHEQLDTSDYTAWGYPFFAQIEPTNICNLKCPLCPVSKKILGRKPQHMPLDKYKGFIDDMGDYLMLLVMWDWGEPFMCPDLPEMIRYASDRGIRTVTSTNGHFLSDDEYVEAILRSGLSTLILGIDSACEESYQAFRANGSLTKVIAGLQKVVNMKKRLGSETLINMRMVITKQNEHEVGKLRRLARKLGADWFSVKTVHLNYDEAAPDTDIVPRNPKYRYYAYKSGTYERVRINVMCRNPWETVTIFSNGDAVPCCYDYDGRMKVGNVFEEPLTRLWNSPAYQETRKNVYHRNQFMPQCRLCERNFKLSKNGWFTGSYPLDFAKRLQKKLGHLRRVFRAPLGPRARNELKRRVAEICGRPD